MGRCPDPSTASQPPWTVPPTSVALPLIGCSLPRVELRIPRATLILLTVPDMSHRGGRLEEDLRPEKTVHGPFEVPNGGNEDVRRDDGACDLYYPPYRPLSAVHDIMAYRWRSGGPDH